MTPAELRAQEFRNRLRISRQLFPRRRARARLPRKVPPKGVILSYYRQIVEVLDGARRTVLAALEPRLADLQRVAAQMRRVDADDNINDLLDRLGKEFFERLKPAQIEALAAQFARRTTDWEREQNLKQVRAAFGVDVLTAEPRIAARSEAFVRENVALIKSIPSQYFDEVEKRVARAVAAGATAKQLAEEIAKAGAVADDRALLIARDQIGKYYAAVSEARQTAMGVKEYVWRTSNDERVRDEHAAREGRVFSWDDPPEDGHPGEAILCRCYAEPVLTPLLEGDEPMARVAPEVDLEAEVIRPERRK